MSRRSRSESKVLFGVFFVGLLIFFVLFFVVPAISSAVNCPSGTSFHVMRVFKNTTCRHN